MAPGSTYAEQAAPTGSLFRGPGYAVLLVAYGSPRGLDEVEPYLNDVRGGRPTPREIVVEVQRRYVAIGGHSPLLERTEAQAAALGRALGGPPVYVGMRHWHPYITDVLARMHDDGQERVVALALAPHFSRLSVGAYRRAIEASRGPLEVVMVREWFDHPGFLDAVADRVREGFASFERGVREDVALVFTAHSLPRRILEDNDPYPDQLRASMTGVLERIGRTEARFAYQSAGQSSEPWLGPDAADVLRELAGTGRRDILVCPIGFVSDHLEVLYDVDIELRGVARGLGIRLERTGSLNDHPTFIASLADLVRESVRRAGWA